MIHEAVMWVVQHLSGRNKKQYAVVIDNYFTYPQKLEKPH